MSQSPLQPARTARPTALVTGATSGIGRDAALALARQGFSVFATGRNEAALAELAAEAGREALELDAFPLDVTDRASIDAAADRVRRATSGHGLDLLVNNAGFGVVAPMVEVTDADLRAQFETNVFGLVAVTHAFASDMIRRGHGRVINVSSIGGRTTMPMMGSYTATKYAVESISDALRIELAPLGIGVVLIEPGPVRTSFDSRAMSLLGSYDRPTSPYAALYPRAQELARNVDRWAIETAAVTKAILRAATARRPRARYVAPRWMGFAMALLRLLPTRLADAMMRMAYGLSRKQLRPNSEAHRSAA